MLLDFLAAVLADFCELRRFFLIDDLRSESLPLSDPLRKKEWDFFELFDLIELLDFFDLPELLFEAIDFDEAAGCKVWREFIDRCVYRRSRSALLMLFRLRVFPYSILAFNCAFSLFR